MPDRGFKGVQGRIFAVLADGLLHRPEEMRDCLNDELSPISNIFFHITNMRKVLRKHGEDIICQFEGKQSYYRLVQVSPIPPISAKPL